MKMGKLAKILQYYFATITMAALVFMSACSQRSEIADERPDAQVQSVSHQTILVKKKTEDHFWTPRETPVLGDFPALALIPDDSLSKYGGWTGKRFKATGFFRTEKQGGIWWLVDPEGYAFFSVGLNTVLPGVEATADEKNLKERFVAANTSIKNWADKTQIWLGETGFNTLGSWSDWRALNNGERASTPYTEQLHFLTRFVWKDKKIRLGEDFKFKWMHYYVFDPEFAEYCKRTMARIAKRTKEDPYLLGYFTDNELGFRVNQLDRFLTLPQDDLVRKKIASWLVEVRGKTPGKGETFQITQEDRKAFFRFHLQTYYEVVSGAIREADPNHMILGDRFNYDQQDNPLIWQIAGEYIDIFSYNWYHVWNPNENNDIQNWQRWSDKPVMITEWYAKGLDTGMKNDTGAGWIVETQDERGKFYEAFALGLFDDPSVVGFHWFQYRDNNVDAAHLVDWSNRDSNKGMVDVDYKPYKPLEDRARRINKRVYGIRGELLGTDNE